MFSDRPVQKTDAGKSLVPQRPAVLGELITRKLVPCPVNGSQNDPT
jgi:hypothetical protein